MDSFQKGVKALYTEDLYADRLPVVVTHVSGDSSDNDDPENFQGDSSEVWVEAEDGRVIGWVETRFLQIVK